MKISTHRWGWMVNTTPSWIQLKQKQWSLPTAHQHPHPGLKAPSWWTAKPLTSLKVTWDSFLASLIQTDTIVMIMILSYAGWGEEGPGMCIATISRALQSAEQRKESLLCDAVCFDFRNRKNIVAPRHKTNTSESGERPICLPWEPAVPNCSITAVWIFHEDETSKSDWYYQGL